MTVLGIAMMAVSPMMSARATAHRQPAWLGELPGLRFHAGCDSRHVWNDICTQTHRVRGARLPSRVVTLGGGAAGTQCERAGQQCKRASQMDNPHVITPALRVLFRRGDLKRTGICHAIGVHACRRPPVRHLLA